MIQELKQYLSLHNHKYKNIKLLQRMELVYATHEIYEITNPDNSVYEYNVRKDRYNNVKIKTYKKGGKRL
jgi:hypothetical protein